MSGKQWWRRSWIGLGIGVWWMVTATVAGLEGPGKRALLVGVSGYERSGDGGWGRLSTRDEVVLLKETLQQRFGFADKDVVILTTPEETTREAILQAFQRHLIDATKPGEIVYFHFSGHGQPIPDDGQDELDGYDESLVPSDYVSKMDGSRNIRDDELGRLIERLKAKRPASVLISLDACFTGTATRGEEEGRGDDWRGAPVAASRRLGVETSASGFDQVKGYVVLSAAAPRQSARQIPLSQGARMGLFSWALIEGLKESGPSTSYRDLLETVANRMAIYNRLQNPQIEGEIDTSLLNGTALKQELYFGLNLDREKRVWLKGGMLQGVTKGSRFTIHRAQTKSVRESPPLGEGEVIEVETARARLKLASEIPPMQLQGARAFEAQHAYVERRVHLTTRYLERVEGGKEVADLIASSPEALLDPLAFDLLIRGATQEEIGEGLVQPGFRGVILEQQNGIRLGTIEAGPELISRVREAIEREWRLLTVRSLERGDPRLGLELRVVPVEIETEPTVRILKSLPPQYTPGGQQAIAVGGYFQLEIRNTGTLPVYVTILNLASDRNVSLSWPPSKFGQPASDNYLPAPRPGEPAKWQRLEDPIAFVAQPPLGVESFMAIGTTTPTDFTPLIFSQTRSGDRSNQQDARRSLLARRLARATRSRSADDESLTGPPDWTTKTVSFQILR